MKNFDAYMAKQITAAAIPKETARRLCKAKRNYKDIKELIYLTAKRGSSNICINYLPLEPEIYQWLKEEGFRVEHTQPFSYRISWD